MGTSGSFPPDFETNASLRNSSTVVKRWIAFWGMSDRGIWIGLAEQIREVFDGLVKPAYRGGGGCIYQARDTTGNPLKCPTVGGCSGSASGDRWTAISDL
eukprot:EG_transcript_30792